ncbi:MAG: acyltransferase [Sedimentisphaerales bacterium]|jgi:acetyltransferase-like isoleucine patch superfamily enzyme
MRLGILFRAIRDKIYNNIDPIGYTRELGVNFGKNCQFFAVRWGSEPYLITIGDHVAITHATFITHDGAMFTLRHKMPDDEYFAPITVGNNVFIGYGSIVMPGVNIGDNVVIGAGAVVTRDIPSNCVAVGVPAKPLKSHEEYYQGMLGRTVKTHKFTPHQKKEFLLKHFNMK